MSLACSFTTVYCSSEDPNHPFQYLFRNDVVSGWRSLPNPTYPIESIVDMRNLFILNGIEIVSHESMITTRVDLFGTNSEVLDSSTTWNSIGFFNFNDNQRSQWKARELKRVSIDHQKIRYLRFVISPPHQTPSNQMQQCSFISLEIQGRKDLKPRLTDLDTLVSDLITAKMAAVEEENFSAAADYKQQLNNVDVNREVLSDLLQRRSKSLANEEYLKTDELNRQIMSILTGEHQPPVKIEEKPPTPVKIEEKQSTPIKVEEKPEAKKEETPLPEAPPPEEPERIEPPQEPPRPEPQPPKKFKAKNDDDVPVGPSAGGGNFFLTEFGNENPFIPASDNQSSPAPKKIKKERIPRQIHIAVDHSSDSTKADTVEELTDEAKAEADVIIELFGENIVATAYSTPWNLKVQGYEKLCELIKNLKSRNDKVRAFQGMMPLMRRRFHEGLKAVYVGAVEQTIALSDAIDLKGNEMAPIVYQLLPLVIPRLGDSNQRINDASNAFVIWCAEKDKNAMNEVMQYALKPTSSPNQYHVMKAKLELLKYLIEKHGESGKIKAQDALKQVLPCLESRKAELRQVAFDLIVQMYAVFGSSIEKYMAQVPRIVKDQLKQTLSEKGTMEKSNESENEQNKL